MTLPRRGITSRLRKISYNGRRDEIPADPTVDEFTKLYGIVITTADSPPSKVTSERYVRCLQRVCEGGGVKRIRRLNAAAVERFKDSYIRSALPEASQGRRNAATTSMAMVATSPPPNNIPHTDTHNALRKRRALSGSISIRSNRTTASSMIGWSFPASSRLKKGR